MAAVYFRENDNNLKVTHCAIVLGDPSIPPKNISDKFTIIS